MMKKLSAFFAAVLLLFVLCVPAMAQETEQFVFDPDGYLDEDAVNTLNTAAEQVSRQYDCGVYLAVFSNMGDYGFSDIESFGEEVYRSFELGYSEGGDGILLVMSMEDRDYDLTAYGDYANYAFTDYAKSELADYFLDNFRNNDWAGGFARYILGCEKLLDTAASGEPLDISYSDDVSYVAGYGYTTDTPKSLSSRITDTLPIGLIVGVIVGFIRCAILKGKMKSAVAATQADDYVCEHGVEMRAVMDQFTHTTVVRQHINRDSGSRSGGGGGGGTHVNSGGFSHHSGKF